VSHGNEQLRAGAEFDAIRELVARWGPLARGIGDDAALLDVPRGDKLVASVDACIEGQHFRRGWLTPREIGYRAVAAASSDLAAMAARPSAVLLSLVVPDQWRGTLAEIADGIGDAVSVTGAHIVGGNVARGELLEITTTVLGSVRGPLRRDGARAGDRIYVTGQLGAPGAALDALLAGKHPPADQMARFAAPVPRISEAIWLAARGATSATDISDGLSADAANIEAASGVTLAMNIERIPAWPGVTRERALRSGEEYELLVTGPGLDCAEFEARFGLPLTEIGVVQAGDSDNASLPRAPGFDHFSR